MPEAPEMQVVAEFLECSLPGKQVQSARILKPVVRSLAGDFAADIVGRRFESVQRRGKFLTLHLSGDRRVVINPKLMGGIQHCPSKARVQKRACVQLGVEGGFDLRYIDDRQMGQFYYVSADSAESVPGFVEQGPDALLDDFGFDDFDARLKRFHGEIKGVLTRGRVVSGIGNAYADEILFEAGVFPFRRRKSLSRTERERIYECSRSVIEHATQQIRERMGDRIDHKIRDFLAVHNKGGQPCPKCGGRITELRANRRITSYCRSCQPGMLLKN